MTKRLHGNFPILATAFHENEEFDRESQVRLIEYMIDAGVHGLVTLANASEGFALNEEEKKEVGKFVVDQVNGRIPVVVTVSHPSTKVATQNAVWAEDMGADAILCLPAFFGTWVSDAEGIYNHFKQISDHVSIPIIIQDHPLSGNNLPAPLLIKMAKEIENVKYYKIECPRAAFKIETVAKGSGDNLLGIFGGAAGISFLEELDRGASGTMPSSSFPHVFSQIYNNYVNGNRDQAVELFSKLAHAVSFEWELGGRHVQKEILYARGIIESPKLRGPIGLRWDDRLTKHLKELMTQLDARLNS